MFYSSFVQRLGTRSDFINSISFLWGLSTFLLEDKQAVDFSIQGAARAAEHEQMLFLLYFHILGFDLAGIKQRGETEMWNSD